MIVIGTAHDANYAELAAITFPSVAEYAEKHRYRVVYEPNISAVEADACKARLFLSLYRDGRVLGRRCVHVDRHRRAVMNSEKELVTNVLPSSRKWHFLWGFDFNGPNSGVWFARFTSQAAHYIRTYATTAIAMGWGDQEAMVQKMLQPPFCYWVLCLPGKFFNAYDYKLYGIADWAHKNEINNYEPGDFILHAAGMTGEDRLRVLREYERLRT